MAIEGSNLSIGPGRTDRAAAPWSSRADVKQLCNSRASARPAPRAHARAAQRLAVLAAALAVSLSLTSAALASTGFGELTHFGERATPGLTVKGATASGRIAGFKSGEGAELAPNYAIGVDPDEANAVFVLDEPVQPIVTLDSEKECEPCTFERHVRIQRFSASGTFSAVSPLVSITSPQRTEEETLPEEEAMSNIAIDATRSVLYVLVTEPRSYLRAKDVEAPAAYELLAFKTAASGKTLVPAEGASPEGVLDTPAQLGMESEEIGKALLEPRGITVDPATGEVIILAHIDTVGSIADPMTSEADRVVLQRVSSKGVLGARYVDETNYFHTHSTGYLEPTSPVVVGGGHERVLVRYEGVAEVPYSFTSKAAPTQLTAGIPKNVESVLAEGLEHEDGGALSLSPEGALWEPALVSHDLGASGEERLFGAYRRASSNGAVTGWSGGQLRGSHADECVLEPGSEEEPLELAAGSEEKVWAVVSEYMHPTEESFKPLQPRPRATSSAPAERAARARPARPSRSRRADPPCRKPKRSPPARPHSFPSPSGRPTRSPRNGRSKTPRPTNRSSKSRAH